jgi:hypothetical protein
MLMCSLGMWHAEACKRAPWCCTEGLQYGLGVFRFLHGCVFGADQAGSARIGQVG